MVYYVTKDELAQLYTYIMDDTSVLAEFRRA